MQRDCATAACCAYVRKVHCAIVRTRFVDVMSFASAVVAWMLMQQRGKSFSANISGGRKRFTSCIFQLFHSRLTALQLSLIHISEPRDS